MTAPLLIFGRKVLTPPSLLQFSRSTLFRAWVDRFMEFLERFHLSHYILPQSAGIRDGGTQDVLLVLFQALASAEDTTTAGCLLTTILALNFSSCWDIFTNKLFHHLQRSSPAKIVASLMMELGISDLKMMDPLEEVLQTMAPTPNESLGNFLWRTQSALVDYNSSAPKHMLALYSERRLFLKLLPVFQATVCDLFLPELRQAGRDFLPFPMLFRILQDRIRLDAARQVPPLLLNVSRAPAAPTAFSFNSPATFLAQAAVSSTPSPCSSLCCRRRRPGGLDRTTRDALGPDHLLELFSARSLSG
jgi:hypothetical protein